MKNFLPALSLPVLLLASCVPSTPQARMEQFPQKFDALDAKQRALVQQGQIARGMSPMPFISLGAAFRNFPRIQGRQSTPSAGTTRAQARCYATSFYGGYGYGYGPYGPTAPSDTLYRLRLGPEIAYVPYRIASVWFVNSRVDSWERAR